MKGICYDMSTIKKWNKICGKVLNQEFRETIED